MTEGYKSMSTVQFEELPDLEAWAAPEKITAEHRRITDEFRRIMESPADSQELVG